MAEIYESVAIAELEEKTALAGTDLLITEDSEGTKKTTVNALKDFIAPDSGWLSPTVASQFEVYTAGKPPKYRKIGKVVEVRGILKPKSTLSASSVGTEYTMFTLPAGYRPSDRISLLMQGSGMNKWMFDIGTDGVCSISRYGGTAVTDIPSGAWLSFQASYFVD